MKEMLEADKRIISGSTMKSVMQWAPADSYRLTDESLNKTYVLIGLNHFKINDGNETFSALYESEDGKVITLSAGALKRSRVATSSIKVDKFYKKNKNILTRSNAEGLWNGSTYFHIHHNMKKDEDFVLPGKLKLRYAILFEDRDTNEPMLNPYYYKGFRKVVESYTKKGSYPTMDDFREELMKSETEGRFSFLPKDMQIPTPYEWVKLEPADFRHTLVFESI